MGVSGVGSNAMHAYQTIKTMQQSQKAVQQNNNKLNKSAQPVNSDPDHDGDIDGLGKDIDVRV